MAAATEQLLLPQEQPRRRPPVWGLTVAALLLVLLLAATGPLRPRLFRAPPPAERVALTLLSGAKEKGAVCVDGTPPGYHLQRGSGDGADRWLVHLEGGGWCSTVKECSGSRLSTKGSSNFMKPIRFMGNGILGGDQLQNPDFYNWNKVYVRYCDGASFSGDAEAQAQDGTTLYFRGLRIYEAVIDELMEKGLTNATQALFTGCSAGALSMMLHCDDFRARFPQEVSVKCFADAGFFLDEKDISGKRSLWSLYDRVIHLQIRNVLVPDSSAPGKSWLSCKENIRNCNSTQVEVLDGLRNKMVNDLKVVEDKEDWGMFIDSCFTHCQSLSGVSWHSPTSPRLENKTIAEAVGDWHSGRSQGAKEIDCKYQCNPTCNSLPPPRDVTAFDHVEIY
ncbi:unnamed protein product [Triticum turgidum subsp. durum]|uniref:Pectin acetylesterase n=1 Tax=Triticum turgidum subsp. durum TaxID=4567 RepID=A0A9R0VTF9_TRITD|nr:unnamed protein product [Triticum turgidum subsp. durum]